MKERGEHLTNLLVTFWRTGKTQRDFSERIGLGYSVFNQILNGRVRPREDEKKRIADGLGVEVEQIFPSETS